MNRPTPRTWDRGTNRKRDARALRGISAVLVAVGLLVFLPGGAQALLLGDLDGNDALDVRDVLLLNSLLVDPSAAIPGSDLFRAADVAPLVAAVPDPDGIVNSGDLVVLMRALVDAGLTAMPAPQLDPVSPPTSHEVTISGTTLPGSTVTLFAPGSAYYFQGTGGLVAITTADENGVFSFEGVIIANAGIGTNNFTVRSHLGSESCVAVAPDCGESSTPGIDGPPSTFDLTTPTLVSAGQTLLIPAPTSGFYDAVAGITVDAGGTLILVGRTQFKMNAGASIDISGRLQAIGAGSLLSDRVQFVSGAASPDNGDWQGIEAFTGADVEIRYAVVADTNHGYLARESGVASRISHSWFRNAAGSCVERCHSGNLYSCGNYAISIWRGYAEITDNVVYKTGAQQYGAGIVNIQSTANGSFVRRNAVHRSHKGFLSGGSGTDLTDNITIENWIGIEIRGPASLGSNRFYGDKYGVRTANWEDEDDPLPLVNEEITVATGAVLTTSALSVANAIDLVVAPGAELHFYSDGTDSADVPDGELLVGNEDEENFCGTSRYEAGGKLIVQGANGNPAIFDVSPEAIPVSEPNPDGLSAPTYRIDPNVPAIDGTNRWDGIRITDPGSGSVIDHAWVLNARAPVFVEGAGSTTATVRNSTFDDFGSDTPSNSDISAAIHYELATGDIEANVIAMTNGTGGEARSGILLDRALERQHGN